LFSSKISSLFGLKKVDQIEIAKNKNGRIYKIFFEKEKFFRIKNKIENKIIIKMYLIIKIGKRWFKKYG